MAKEIVILCDACQASDARTPGTVVGPVTLPSMGPRTLDLCEKHSSELITPLQNLLTRYGVAGEDRPPRRTPITPAKVDWSDLGPCLLCGRTYRDRAHFPRNHKASPTEIFGLTCPLDGKSYDVPKGLSNHFSIHGARQVGHLFEMAQEQGDPLGIVAERLKLARENGWMK